MAVGNRVELRNRSLAETFGTWTPSNRWLCCLAVVMVLSSGCTQEAPRQTTELDAGRLAPEGRLGYEPGPYRFDKIFSQPLQPGAYEPTVPVRHVLSSSVDGADVEMAYLLPKLAPGERVPVLVDAGPYYRPAGSIATRLDQTSFLASNFVPHGYAVALVSVRGTGGSGGCQTFLGKHEVADLDQAITWLAQQPWSNGNVGMMGVSYDGTTPWMVASTGNPHLKTIVPVSGINDLYRFFYRNGSATVAGYGFTNFLYYEYGWNVFSVFGSWEVETGRSPQQRAEGFVCPEAWDGLVAAHHASLGAGRGSSAFWADRDFRARVETRFKGSVYVVNGLQDWIVAAHNSVPWVQHLNASGTPVRMMLGQWGHTQPDWRHTLQTTPTNRFDFAQDLLRWFDRWLKNETQTPLGPQITVQDTSYRWRIEDSWPPRQANWTTYHLAEAKLAPEPASPGRIRLNPNPYGRSIPEETGRLVPGAFADFVGEPLQSPITLAGLPRVHVRVASDGEGGHLAAWLYDQAPDGKRALLGWTAMDLRFHDGGDTPRALVPRQEVVAKMEMQPMDARVEAGHRLVLRLWQYGSEDHPFRGYGVPGANRGPTSAWPLTVSYGGDSQSVLEVAWVDPPVESYFRPPMPDGYRYPYEK